MTQSMNSSIQSDATLNLAQSLANSRQEPVYVIMDNATGLTQTIPASEFVGISDHLKETLMRLVVPKC